MKEENIEKKTEYIGETKKIEEEKKEEEKVALAKFSPLKNKENIYSIQFRSSKDKKDIVKVQKQIEDIIDTKIEFIQGFYRLFAKDLYSEEYAQIIAHEIKREYGLNPVVRNLRQYDYMLLGSKKYNEKYGIEEKKKLEEKKLEEKKLEEKKENEKNLAEEKKETIKENLPSTGKNIPEININDEKIEVTKEKVEENTVSLNGVTIKKYENREKEEKVLSSKPESIKLDEKEEVSTSVDGVEVNKNTKLIFLTEGTNEEADKIKESIDELMELDIINIKGKYTIKSREYFSEAVAEDLSGKLNLLFNITVEREFKN